MTIYEQGTKEWFAQRLGKITASRLDDVVGMQKSGKGYLAGRETYMWELVGEILTGNPSQHYVSTAMMHGMEHEPFARKAFSTRTGMVVEKVGFIDHPTIGRCGASPDGLVDGEWGLEIKCPYNLKNHLQAIKANQMPEQHMAQIQGQMMCSGLQGSWFVSYYPYVPPKFQVFHCFVPRRQDYIEYLEKEVEQFLLELADLTGNLHDRVVSQ